MDVSSEVKQRPKRFKKNYGVSTISLATIIENTSLTIIMLILAI